MDIVSHYEEVLNQLGYDTKNPGLIDTPKRHIKMLEQFLSPPRFEFTTFEQETDEMVIIKDILFYSLCEHHIVPFFGTAAIAYIPRGKQVGLSKLPRLLESVACRLQNQERIGKQVVEYLNQHLSPDAAIVLKARHLCVEMRGVKKPGCETVTSTLSGCFKTDVSCRQEFINLIK